MTLVHLIIIIATFPKLISAIVCGSEGNLLEASKGIALIDVGYGRHEPPYCTGALITREFVLTSARCCSEDYKHTVVHVCSTTPFEAGGQFYKQMAFWVMGRNTDSSYNVCVIRLNQPAVLGPYCTPLALPIRSIPPGDTQQLYHAFGYGAWNLIAPSDIGTMSVMYRRVLGTRLIAIEYPRIEDQFCDKYFDRGRGGYYNVSCHGDVEDSQRRLMPDDMAAPVVGSKDNVVYTILNTQSPFKIDVNWLTEAYPIFGLDVFSARNDILRAMVLLKNMTVFK